MAYSKILLELIEREKSGAEYICPEADRPLLGELLREINRQAGTSLRYLAELDAFNIPGAGEIAARYIEGFSSESVRGYLIPQIAAGRVADSDRQILRLYLHFKASDEYISKPGCPAPAHIYVRYDNAFRKLRPKRLAKDLVELVRHPRDAFYLPLTTRMLASWRLPEMFDLLIRYSSGDGFTASDVGLRDGGGAPFYPPLEFMRRELRLTAVNGLRYFPSPEAVGIVESLAVSADGDIRAAAKRALEALTAPTPGGR